MMRIPWRRGFYILGSLAGLALLIRQAIIGWNSLPALFPSVAAIMIIGLGLVCAVLAVGLPIAAFYCLLRGTGMPVTLREVACRYTFTFLPRYIPGSVWGYISRGEWLHQELGIPHAVSYSASFFELAASVATALAFAGGLLLPDSPVARLAYALVCGLVFLLMWAAGNQLSRLIHSTPADSGRWTWLPNRRLHLSMWAAALILYGLHWLLNGLAFYFVIQSDAPAFMSGVAPGVIQAGELYAAAWLVGFLVLIAPAGMGFRETALAGLLILWGNIPVSAAAGQVLLLRFLFVFAEVLWTLSGFVFFRGSKDG